MVKNMAVTRKEFIEKYHDVLAQMAELGETGDLDVLFDKLIYAAQDKEGTQGDKYLVPEDFDLVAFAEDIKRLA